MLRSNAKYYDEIRNYLDIIPIIETHEHYAGITEPITDVMTFILDYYYGDDFLSASFDSEQEARRIANLYTNPDVAQVPFERRYKLFREIYKKANKTSYARGMQMGLKACWGIEKLDEPMSIKLLEEKLKSRNQAFYENIMEACGIKAAVVDIYDIKQFLEIVEGDGSNYTKYCRFSFPLPAYHKINSKAEIQRLDPYAKVPITSLDHYLESFENLLKKCIKFGIVCFKDQSAYTRALDFANPTRDEAEKVFNTIFNNPGVIFGDDEVRSLDDWLFNQFMRLAAEYKLPVQIHTGLLSGTRTDIARTNAVHLTKILEMHQDVKFDLFHGNWPYMDEYLFLGKSYPNVWLNLCWVQLIDPLYSIELMKRALVTVPHAKVMAFGGDTNQIEWAAGYLELARDNVACALSEMVDSGWIDFRSPGSCC